MEGLLGVVWGSTLREGAIWGVTFCVPIFGNKISKDTFLLDSFSLDPYFLIY